MSDQKYHQALTANRKLLAEVARLKAEVERLRIYDVEHWKDQWLMVIEDNNRLKAEVERLRKAGDAVCESPYLLETDHSVIAWRAAKEGKQS